MELTGVSETLLIPLYCRVLETQREGGIIQDPKSLEVTRQLNLDFSKFAEKIEYSQLGCAIRTEILDQETSKFLAQYPNAIVINLGAGLCTRFFRVDNQQCKWFELDLPSVKTLWSDAFSETERHKFLAYSVLDFAWIDEIKPLLTAPVLLIAEGLLMYFEEAEVKHILKTLQTHFPQGHMLLEAFSPLMVKRYKKHPQVSQTQAAFKWGIKTGKQLKDWNDKIQFIEEWYYFDRYGSRWRWMRFYRYVPSLRKIMKIIHLKFL